MKVRRDRKRLGLRPVTVLVSEQEINFLLARHYELTRRTTARSAGRSRRTPSIRLDLVHPAAEKITLVLEGSGGPSSG